MASSKFGDLNVTEEELERLSKALKNEEFRKLFAEYADEISDPENRKRYEEEIAQLEREKGVDVKFVHPNPGYVLKTSVDGTTKTFVNVCCSENIGKPTCENKVAPDGKRGLAWRLPHSFAPVRDDVDKKGGKCKVIDFVVHPDTYRMGESNGRFREMLHDTMSDSIKQQFGLQIDQKNLKLLQMKFKGTPTATVIRSKQEGAKNLAKPDPDDIMNKFPYPYGEAGAGDKHEKKHNVTEKKTKTLLTKETSPSPDAEFTAPMYTVKHRRHVDMKDFYSGPGIVATDTCPKELVVEVELPLLKSAAPVTLDIFEKRLVLQSTEQAKYKLDIALPYAVDENEGCAKFDKAKRKLIITLPVIPALTETKPMLNDCGSVDGQEANDDQDQAGNRNGVQVTGEKPLIEMIGLQESSEDATGEEDPATPGDLNSKEAANAQLQQTEPDVPHSMPEFSYNQTDETFTIIMQISNVQPRSVMVTCLDKKMMQLRAVSVGQGGFPIYYCLCVGLPGDRSVNLKASNQDVSPENVVFVFMKSEQCQGMWDHILVGPDCAHLQEKLLLTERTIIQQLDALDEEHAAMSVAKERTLDLEVTEMNSDKLTVEIKDDSGRSRRKKHLSESAEDIKVVHDKQIPKLHGILKQRSRTLSESSDDVFGMSVDRQNSSASVTSSEGIVTESDDSPDGPGRKKSVSFSEQVDQTTYKANNSVSSMHSTLKNKRRRVRKKEQKLERQHQRRIRRSSGGSEPSSDEHNLVDDDDSESGIPVVVAARPSGQSILGVQSNNGCSTSKMSDIQESKGTSSGLKKPAGNGRDVTSVSSGLASGGEVTHDSDTLNGTAHDTVSAQIPEGTMAVTSEPALGKAQGSVQGHCEDALGEVQSAESKPLESAEGGPGEQNAHLVDPRPSDVYLDESGSAPVLVPKEACMQPSENANEAALSKASIDTALSWKEIEPSKEHKTKCVVELSNGIIFDLDTD